MKLRNIVAVLILSLAFVSFVDARGSSFRSAPVTRSAPSSFRTPAARPVAPPVSRQAFQTSAASPKAAPATANATATPNRQTFSGGGFFSRRPSVTNAYTPSPGSRGPVTVYHEHHYFGYHGGGCYGCYGGYSGGFGHSPFFWLWLLDRPHTQVVYASPTGDVSASAPVTAPVVTQGDEGPSFLEKFFNIVLGLALLALIGAIIVWIVRKAFR